MSRPLSDAETTFMPELHHTRPYAAVRNTCGWCSIRLAAIPDAPRQLHPDGPWYHPGLCADAAWITDRDGETGSSGMLRDAEGATSG